MHRVDTHIGELTRKKLTRKVAAQKTMGEVCNVVCTELIHT